MQHPRAPAHAFLLAVALLFASSAAADLRFNSAGPYIPAIGFRADPTSFLTNPATVTVSNPPGKVKSSGSWASVYNSYRWAKTGNLEYKIPVPNDSYNIALLFAETWSGAYTPGVRVFNIIVNGKLLKPAVDVYKAVGPDKPYYVPFAAITPVAGHITVTVARIPGKQNPMLSGLVIYGPHADKLVADVGFGAPASPPAALAPPTKPPTTLPPASDPTCATGIYGANSFTKQFACCEKVCGQCGGAGCGTAASGHLCCISHVNAKAKSCHLSGPPCIPAKKTASTVPPPTDLPSPAKPPSAATLSCPSGILGVNSITGKSACCPSVCGKCGGKGCGSFAPGHLCCISSVYNTGNSCSSNAPPCVPVTGTSSTTAAPVSKPGPTCAVSGAAENQFRLNIAGGAFPSAAMGADNVQYISSKKKGDTFSSSSMIISAASGPAPWDSAYSSHRWTKASVLSYKIPVPAGSFTVKLLFAETYFKAVGKRTFDIFINGATMEKNLDVFKEVGKNVGLVRAFPNIKSQDGNIVVTLIKSIENPMISGIFIEGKGANKLALGGGCSDGSTKGTADDNNGGFDHRSHSVPGGPYIATDFDKNGKAFIHFDGTQSHSHYSDPGPPEVTGTIVAYKWTWTEIVNGIKVKKVNTDKSGKFTAAFPLGKTTVTLEVVDSTGDVAIDTATVEVKDSTEDGAYCYYYDYGSAFYSTVPLSQGLNTTPKPLYGSPVGKIKFKTLADFGSFSFSDNSFAVRCKFFIDVPTDGSYSYAVTHNGPFKLFHAGTLMGQSSSKGTTKTSAKNLKSGLNSFQLLYFRPKNMQPQLVLSSAAGSTLSSNVLQHDSSATLPVIAGLSKTSSTPAGGQNIQIYGSAFINGVAVKFGDVEAPNLVSSDLGNLQVTVPPGSGQVAVTVSTNAGVSNAFPFTYTSAQTLEHPVIFKQTKVKESNGKEFEASFISAAVYGPDGRLYLGTFKGGQMYAVGINSAHTITSKCQRSFDATRAVLGVAFSPLSNALKMYYTTNSLYWKDKKRFSFENGWPNGKLEAIQFSQSVLEDGGGKSCAGSPQDVVTGLPVSNHDHGVSKLQFLPDGSILITVGGFTNGGISVPGKKPIAGDAPDDLLGGVASNPLSAAIVSCQVNKVTHIKYDQYHTPETAEIIGGDGCKVYASGFRNSFGITLHTNGNLYATDNGPNAGFGDFSTNCHGGKMKPKNIPDKLFLVEKGQYHGHPNINRRECVHYPEWAVQPIVKNLKSSSNGLIEYRSNTFGGQIKGNLYVSMFAGQHSGKVSQVKLEGDGGRTKVGYAPNFLDFSGVSLVEGPRGELVMPRVYQGHIAIANPFYPAPDVTFLLGVHPKQGPAGGGAKVLISGHNFGLTPQATFGGKKCSNVDVIDDSSFTCLTPPMSNNQLVSVLVTGRSGVSPSYGTDYWYM